MARSKPKLSGAMKELAEQFNLTEDKDFWILKQNNNYVLLHDACMRIATEVGVVFDKPVWLQQGPDNWALELSGSLGDKTYWTTGEASPKNTKQAYPLAMAEKRAKDRLTLYLTGHYHQGIKSEIEAEAYAKPKDDKKEDKPTPNKLSPTKQKLIDNIRNKRLALGLTDENMKDMVRDLFGNNVDRRVLNTSQLKQLLEEVKNREQQNQIESLIEGTESNNEEDQT